MSEKKGKIIEYFKRHNGIARFSSIKKEGFHPDVLKKCIKEKTVEKIGNGLYRLVAHTNDPYPDYVRVSLQSDKGVICLISALYFYGATNEIPRFIEVAIPAGSRANKIEYPPVKYYHFSYKTWEAGIARYNMEGCEVKIYSLAKTIADCFKFRNKIGINIAREALKIAITEKGIKPTHIMEFAHVCRVTKIIKPILETIL